MKPIVETVRLSQKAKEQMSWLKRVTGLDQWNVICRWGLCTSLAEPTIPTPTKDPIDTAVEIDWKVFGGRYESIYTALVRERCKDDGLGVDDDTVAAQFRLHLHRGLSYLATDKRLRSIEDLMNALPLHKAKHASKKNR